MLDDPKFVSELAERFSSPERADLFRRLVNAYEANPNVDKYLALRRQFPEADIEASLFRGIEPLFALEKELTKHRIDVYQVAGAMDADLTDIDQLSLRLMELLVQRENLPKSAPGHITARRKAISDSLIDYLIVIMLEGIYQDEHIPSSLLVLTRNCLTGPSPDLYQAYLAKEKRIQAALAAARYFPAEKTISVRDLAKIAHVGRSTAAQWLGDPAFQKRLLKVRGLADKFQESPSKNIKRRRHVRMRGPLRPAIYYV
jgi:hypothetical protein